MQRNLLCQAVVAMIMCSVSPGLAGDQERLIVPEFFGFYAVDHGQLVAIYEGQESAGVRKAGVEWYSIPQNSAVTARAPELSPSARFILFYSNAGEMIQTMTLHRLPRVRNIIETPEITQRAYGAQPHVVATLDKPLLARIPELELRILTKPVPNQLQMVELVPSSQLTQGLYVFYYAPTGKEGWFATFAVTSASGTEQPYCLDLVLPGGYAGIAERANSELVQAAPLLPSFRYRGCDSSSVAPNRGGAGAVPTGEGGGAPPVATPSICSDYDSCFGSGHTAFRSSAWDQAIADFQSAAKSRPNSGLPWYWVGNTYLVMNRLQDAAGAWNKALALQFPLPFTACRERGIQQCEIGALHVSSKSVSFLAQGQTVFDVPLSQITVNGTNNHKNQGYVNFGLDIAGKKYNFDFIPYGVKCPQLAHVNCQRQGADQQIAIGDYLSQTIPKLASGTLTTPAVPTQ